jgi:plasmid stabilization system protein ParE
VKVTLSPKAADYVRLEARYLKSRSPQAALRFVEDLKNLRLSLARFPALGRLNEEIPNPGVLRFVMGSYLVDYEVLAEEIFIFAIRHGHQSPSGLDLEDDFDFEEPGNNAGN